MHKCRFSLVIALSAVVSLASASAHLWESQVEIEKRYGQPIKTTGYPDRRAFIYAFEGLEIKIKFFDGVSEAESYSPSAKNVAFGDPEIRRLLESNSGGGQWREQAKDDWVIDAQNGRAYANFLPDATKPRLDVYTHASIERPNTYNHGGTLKEETFQGVATMRQEGEITGLIVATGNGVIYVPWSKGWRDRALSGRIKPGKTYRITLRDDESIDEGEPTAFVSDRDHKNYSEAVNDSKRYLLVRIQDGDDVVFDRSVCEVHHTKMSEILADYGNSALADDAQCAKNFPHSREFLSGDCVLDPTKKAFLYVCPKCVEGCERSKR